VMVAISDVLSLGGLRLNFILHTYYNIEMSECQYLIC
jgi:hypothetical protein